MNTGGGAGVRGWTRLRARLRVRVAAGALACVAIARPARTGADVPRLSVQVMVSTGAMPKGVTISPDGARLYVANYGQVDHDNVGVHDAHTLRLIEHIDVPGIVVETAVSPDGRTLYASNFRRNSVQFIDLATRAVTHEVTAGTHPKIVVLSRDGRRLFAANWGSRNVTEIDTATRAVVRTLAAGENPRGMAVTRAGRLYIANSSSDNIDVYEGANMERHRVIAPLCRIPRHLTLSPDDSMLYVSCLGAGLLAVVSTTTERVVRSISTPTGPKANDVSPDGRYVVTADYNAHGVTVIDTTDWSSRSLEVPVMDRASGVVFARDGLRVVVTGWFDDHLYSVGVAGAAPALHFTAAEVARAERHRRAHDGRSGEH